MVEIVAEISGNHGGILSKALTLIWEAAECGCDYAKFQYYHPDDMPDGNINNNYAMYQKLAVQPHWLPLMFECAKVNSIGLFASVFSVRAVKELLEYDIPYIKIASPASTLLDDKVIGDILSLVPADVQVIWSFGTPAVKGGKVLYCPAGHPPSITEVDFSIFRRGNFYGFSDHTPGIRTPLAFIRAGAEMIEKHFKLKKDHDCIDASFSADLQTMKLLCKLAHNR